MERRSIVWLVRGLGGLATILLDWIARFGPVPEDQAGIARGICNQISSAIELASKRPPAQPPE